MSKNTRLISVTIFHAIFSNFGDIEANVMSYMSVPVRKFFVESLNSHYRINTTTSSPEFELIYSTIASSFFVGVLFGGCIMGNLMDNYGRKSTSVYIRSSLGILAALSMIMAYYLNCIELFVLGQFLAGVVAALKTVLFVYMAECVPDSNRGFTAMVLGAGGNFLLLFVAPFCLPQMFANDHDWWLLPAFCLVLAMIHLFIAAYFPESPKHLYIAQNQREQSRSAVIFYHGSTTNMDIITDEYERESHLTRNNKVTLKMLLKNPRLRWSTIIVLIAAFVPASSLINLKSQYLEPMLMTFGLDQSKAMISTMLMTAVTSPLCLLAPFVVERFGRRPLFILITVLSTFELVFVSIAQSLVDLRGGQSSEPTGWFIPTVGVFGCFLGASSSMLGILNMTPILTGECCPHAARALVTTIVQVVPMILVLLLVVSYPIVTAHYGVLFLLPMLVLSATLAVLMFKYLPETKGLPVDQIFRGLSVQPDQSSTCLSDSEAPILISDDELSSNYGAIENSETEERRL